MTVLISSKCDVISSQVLRRVMMTCKLKLTGLVWLMTAELSRGTLYLEVSSDLFVSAKKVVFSQNYGQQLIQFCLELWYILFTDLADVPCLPVEVVVVRAALQQAAWSRSISKATYAHVQISDKVRMNNDKTRYFQSVDFNMLGRNIATNILFSNVRDTCSSTTQ